MSGRIGIIGGLSPESTVTYYLYLTRKYADLHGGSTFPEIIIYSVNLENYHKWRDQNRWDLITVDLLRAADKLKSAGADMALIATNTMHKVYNDVLKESPIPIINMLEAVSLELRKNNIEKAGLIGTRFSMEDGFYHSYLKKNDISVITPSEDSRNYIHSKIEQELVKGIFTEETKSKFLEIIDSLIAEGARGIILGCTEIPLLIKQEDSSVPVFDTATIHAEFAFQHLIRGEL